MTSKLKRPAPCFPSGEVTGGLASRELSGYTFLLLLTPVTDWWKLNVQLVATTRLTFTRDAVSIYIQITASNVAELHSKHKANARPPPSPCAIFAWALDAHLRDSIANCVIQESTLR